MPMTTVAALKSDGQVVDHVEAGEDRLVDAPHHDAADAGQHQAEHASAA